MNTLRFAPLTLGFILTAACGADPESGEAALGSVEQDITRGEPVTDMLAPGNAAVRLGNSYTSPEIFGNTFCSGVKIGPRRFLTAAHCGEVITPRVGFPAKVSIINKHCNSPLAPDAGCSLKTGMVEIEVDRFYPHPNFRNEFGVGTDVGVLDVRVDTPSIPIAPIDTSFFPDFAEATYYGYGCNAAPGAFNPTGQKQSAFAIGMSLADLRVALPAGLQSQAPAFYNVNIMLDGTPISPHLPPGDFQKLCKGDSGGPVFTNTGKVAAVNSFGIPETPLSGMPRLAGIRSWINSPVASTRSGSIVNAATGRCLSANGSTASGATLITAFCDGRNGTNDTQYWGREPGLAPGRIVLRNGRSGLYLTADASGPGARITQRPRSGKANQDWAVVDGDANEMWNAGGLKLGTVAAFVNFAINHTVDQSTEVGNRTRWTITLKPNRTRPHDRDDRREGCEVMSKSSEKNSSKARIATERRLAKLVVLGAAVIACGAPDAGVSDEAFSENAEEITNGVWLADNGAPYGSAVRFSSRLSYPDTAANTFCSGAKIGSRRFLLAAHCVTGIYGQPGVGARVSITNNLCRNLTDPNCSQASGLTELTVDRFYLHPSYPGGFGTGFDIGLLEVTSDTPAIPIVALDTAPFADGELGTLVTYGSDAKATIDRMGKKQYANFVALSQAELAATYPSPLPPANVIYPNYVVVDGVPREPGFPPDHYVQVNGGDSGGPFFSERGKVGGVAVWKITATGLEPDSKLSGFTRVAPVVSFLNAPTAKFARGSITSVLSGLCLGVGGSTASGAVVRPEICDGRNGTRDTQYWAVTPGSVAGMSKIMNGKSGMCLASTGSGDAAVVQRPCDTGLAAQQWMIAPAIGITSRAQITNRNSGRPLGYVGRLDKDARLDQSSVESTTTNRQRWIIQGG